LKLAQPLHTIVRIADNPVSLGGFSEALQHEYYDAINHAEFVITPSDDLQGYIQHISATPTLVCPNGVNVAAFQSPRPKPDEFKNESRPIVLYVGAIAPWLDLAMVHEAATLTPNVAYYLVGPHLHTPPSPIPDNVIYLGARSHQSIPAYMQHARVAIAPFDAQGNPGLINGVSAIKLYEYLATGTSVVATIWPQSEGLSKYLTLSMQNANSFAEAINRAISNPRVAIPDKVLRQWDWNERFRPALDKIRELLDLPSPPA
jgi:glycosyltransferase involved in cell wall biosynthesis